MKVKIIIAAVIVGFVVVWLVTNIKGVDTYEYSINTLEELCLQEEEIFTGVLAQGYYDVSNRWAHTLGSLLELSNLENNYTHKISERYDVNPVLYSDILFRLQGIPLDC